MGLDEYFPEIEDSEGWWQSAEAPKEVSEKYKESSKKSQAGVKRTQKDEKKAKRHDFLLANFLVKIILSKKYDELLDDIFGLTNAGITSNLILWILSLISLEISDTIRSISGKEKIRFWYTAETEQEFDDAHIDPMIRNRINAWVEDVIDVVCIEASHLQMPVVIQYIQLDDTVNIFCSKVFRFFLKEIKITISDAKAHNISEFILWEILKQLKKIEVEEI